MKKLLFIFAIFYFLYEGSADAQMFYGIPQVPNPYGYPVLDWMNEQSRKDNSPEMKKKHQAVSYFYDGCQAFVLQNWNTALEYFDKASTNGDGTSCYYAGIINELGYLGHVNFKSARFYYALGKQYNNPECIKRLNHIDFRYPSSELPKQRERFYNFVCERYNLVMNSVNSIVQQYESDPTHRSSASNHNSHCSSCNGTKINPSPVFENCDHYPGNSTWLGYYNSPGNRCPHCGRYTKHYHERCSLCNSPRY